MVGLIDFSLLGPGIDVSQGVNNYVNGLQRKADRQIQQAQLDHQNKLDARTDKIDARDDAQRAAFVAAVDPTTGQLDPDKARLAYASTGDADGLLKFEKSQAEARVAKRKDGIDQLGTIAQIAGSAVDQPSYDRALATAKGLGIDVSTLPPQFDPAKVNEMRLHALDAKSQLEEQHKQEQAELDEAKFGHQVEHDAATLGIQRGQLGVSQARFSEDRRHNRVSEATAAAGIQGAADPLDKTSITYVADQYRKTGQMPPLGMGKQAAAMRAAIIGEAARRDAAEGTTGADAAVNHADYHANRTALATISRTNSNILAFEDTANRNADYVLSTAKKGAGTTGMPLFNAWQQAGRRSIGGNPDVSRFDVAVKTFASEYAKVTSGASGGAVTSDSARHEIDSLINNAQTPAQLAAVISQAKIEMANRREALTDQREALRTQLRGAKPGGASAPGRAASPASITHIAVNGKGQRVGWNGSAWVSVK